VNRGYQRVPLHNAEAHIESLLFFLRNVSMPHGMNQRLIENCQRNLRSSLDAPWPRLLLQRFIKLGR
jgi:hypothetical protein